MVLYILVQLEIRLLGGVKLKEPTRDVSRFQVAIKRVSFSIGSSIGSIIKSRAVTNML